MNTKDSYDQYQVFVQKNFPNSHYLTKSEPITKRFFNLVHGRTIFLDVILRNYSLSSNQANFVEIFNFNLTRLLYTIPTNDDYIINYNFRSLIESLIKLIYFGIAFRDKQNFNESYRNLKNELKSTEFYNIAKNECDQLFNYYSMFSEELHQKKGVSGYSKSFLEEIMSSPPSRSLETRISQLEKVVIFLENIIIDLPTVSLKDLSGPDRFLLNNELGQRWFNKYFN